MRGAWSPPASRAPWPSRWRPGWSAAFSPQAHGQTFTFPDLFPEKPSAEGEGGPCEDTVRQELLEEQRKGQSRDPRRGGVPDWFGL